jgi:protein-L-isoaspartate(D-aspartate) O-methyltransferase
MPTTDLDLADLRQRMVITQLAQRGIRDVRVLAVMARVPRHEFVSSTFREHAYDDSPLPIGEAQTISQPYIVALMLELLRLNPADIVLEVGTGSGYQTALLAELCSHVYSIERHPALSAEAQSVLDRLACRNITLIVGDGTLGLPDHAPYDAILVSAAAPECPATLFAQLKETGRLVVPVGPPEAQLLQLILKEKGHAAVSTHVPCRFVPLIGEHGYKE